MEDVIKLYDNEIQEGNFEQSSEGSEEEYHSYKKANTTLGDVIMIQCILCVLIIIALAVLNLVRPELTNEILRDFKQHLDKPFELKNEMNDIVSSIIGSFNAKL